MDFSPQIAVKPTAFGLISTNITTAGANVKISCPVDSGEGVSCYIVSWNNTGRWVNQTITRFADFINTTAAYASFSGILNTVAGNTISAVIYANDSSNNWASSSKFNFMIKAGVASKIEFTVGTSQYLRTGELSSIITVQRQDKYGNPVTTGSTTISLTSTSDSGVFYSDTGKTAVTSVIL